MSRTEATENKPYYRAMVELRRSSAAQPHKNKARYDRKQNKQALKNAVRD